MIVLLFLFFLSGLVGIVYEVIWIRIFTDILGSSVQSVSAVTIAFLLGLGIGGYLFGKRVDQSSRPLRFYSLLETGIGLTVILNYWLFIHSGPMVIALTPYLDYSIVKWFSFFIAFIFISIPALFIGGTFPAISKSLIHYESNLEEKLGRLYSINTFGAGIGALVSGLILIKYFGFHTTLFLCAGMNILISIMVLVIEKNRPVLEFKVKEHNKIIDIEKDTSNPSLFCIAFLSGFAALGYEIIWFKLFNYVFKGWLLGFSILLCLFLLGVAIGSKTLVGIKNKNLNGLKMVGIAHLIIALSAIIIIIVSITPNRTIPFFEKNIVTIFMVIIATTWIGVIFPMLSFLCTRKITLLGHSIGSIGFFNILGNVSGSFLVGFILIPFLGTENSHSVLIILNIFILLFIFLYLLKDSNRPLFLFIGVCLMSITFLFSNKSGALSNSFYKNRFGENSEIVYSLENRIDRKVVIKKNETTYLLAGPCISGATDRVRRRVQISQGHVSMMLCRNNADVLEIGYGVGEIARCISNYGIQNFDIAEIDPDMIPIADRFFYEINHNVSLKEGVKTIIMDGRHYLNISKKKYDLIMSDTFIVFGEGSTRLYTLEHFKRGREHLKEEGLFICWIPSNLPLEPALSIIKTFNEVFPEFIGWYFPDWRKKCDLFLVGRKISKKIDVSVIFNKFDSIAKEDMAVIGIDNKNTFLSGFFKGKWLINDHFNGIRLHTEDRPFLDYALNPFQNKELDKDQLRKFIEMSIVHGDISWIEEFISFNNISLEERSRCLEKLKIIRKTHFKVEGDGKKNRDKME